MSSLPPLNGKEKDSATSKREFDSVMTAANKNDQLIQGKERTSALPANRQRQHESLNFFKRPKAASPTKPTAPPGRPAGSACYRPAPNSARSVSSNNSTDELKQLKKKLHQQQERLAREGGANGNGYATPQRTQGALVPRSPQTASPVHGVNYAVRPYSGVKPRIMWEPFNNDPDVIELTEKAQRSEERISRSANSNDHALSSRRPDATIPPPDPKVFSATDDQVPELAAAAENFAENANGKMAASTNSNADRVTISEQPSAENSRATSPKAGHLTEGHLLKRVSSAVKVDRGTVSLLNSVHMPSVDLVLPSPNEIDFDRQGDVLGRKTILKRDLFDGVFTRRDLIGVMSGAPYFRMIPKFNIGAVAQANVSGLQTAVNEIFKVYQGKVMWFNLREEALCYINGRSYVIRSESNPVQPIMNPGITSERIESMEAKLKREVLEEAENHGGNVCVHKENATGKIGLLWEAVNRNNASVSTMNEAVTSLNSDNDRHPDNIVEYHRLPVPQQGMMLHQFDYIVKMCKENPVAPIMFNCQSGRGKSTVAMITAAIVRYYQHGDPMAVADSSLLRGDGRSSNFRTIMKLVTLLPNGVIHERRVSILCDVSGRLSNLRERIGASFKQESPQKATALLRQYAYLVTFSCYCEQVFHGDEPAPTTFEAYLKTMPDVKILIEGIALEAQHPEHERMERRKSVEVVSGDADLMSIAKEINNRSGSVLCPGMVLRSYPTELAAKSSSITGVMALRQFAPDVPMFTCGRSTAAGLEDLIYTIKTSFPTCSKIHWVNVRAEPSVYINGNPYIMLDESAYSEDELASLHITGDRIEEIETRLKNDVINEARKYNGMITLHQLTPDEGTKTERVNVERVHTPRGAKEVFDDGLFVYHRLPLPATDKVRLRDFSPLIEAFRTMEPDSAVILTDSGGGMRTTLALNLLTLVRASSNVPLRNIRKTPDLINALKLEDCDVSLSAQTAKYYGGAQEKEISSAEGEIIELHAGSQLSQMMTAGHLMRTLQLFLEQAGRGVRWNILEAMDLHKTKAEREVGDAKRLHQFRAVCSANVYLDLLVCMIFIDDCRAEGTASKTLDDWVACHPEIQNFFDKANHNTKNLLKYVVRKALPAEHSIEDRAGDVLATNFGIKADHFPGCQRKGMNPAISGAPNFRKVKHLNIYGVAIPTLRGVSNVLNVLGASEQPFYQYPQDPVEEQLADLYPHERLYARNEPTQQKPAEGRVLWMNLREEPILYVEDRPFVFRDLTNPYVNVEMTGIEIDKIEYVEERLRDDVLAEASQFNGEFMVHDEGKPGQLIGVWEPTTEENCQTVRRVYEREADRGTRVKFVRLPVTDEQSPELKDFDTMTAILLPEIIKNMEEEENALSLVFNCQMGRGRTTTGMVIGGMLVGLLYPDYYAKLAEEHPKLWPDDATESARGFYSCISQLISVLTDGNVAKKRVDLVLEACNRMQNLRAAIELFKDQVESAESNEEARARALHHGINYLQRYFNLICFSSYLHEVYDPNTRSLKQKFVAWRADRDELRHIHDAAVLK